MIKFENVSVSFNGRPVLEDLSFAIKANETVSLIGPSGIGKTTVLRLITGSVVPDRGSVVVNSSRIGYVFQEPRLLPWRTTLDNMTSGLRAWVENRKTPGFWLESG